MLPDFNVRTQKQTITQGKYDRKFLKTQPDPFHRGISISDVKIREVIWGGGRGSAAYDSIRGAEQLYYERALQKGVAAEQISPIRANNPKAAQYIEAAREIGATPCP